jgi:DNA mismatch repair ATPase MutS
MAYIIFCAIAVILIVLLLRYSNKLNQRKTLENIRKTWGRQKTGSFYFDRIEKYTLLQMDKHPHRLSKQTLDDIDFHDLFSFIDRTNSKIGQQFLFNTLIHPLSPLETLQQLDGKADLFSQQTRVREDTQQWLRQLNNNDAYYIAALLQDKLLAKPKWFRLLYINVSVIVLLLGLSIYYPICLVLAIIPATVNMFLHYWNKNNTFQYIRSFPQLSILINVCAALNNQKHYSQNKVAESISSLRPFQWKLGLLSFGKDGGVREELSQLAMYIIELAKAFFLVELFTLFHLTKELEKRRESILCLFNFIGEIDIALSVASLRAGNLHTCRPEFMPATKDLTTKNIYHPLIKKCVKNDLTLHSKSILITGSNMSGKTTFLRTVVLNSILAQSLYTCFADEYKTPFLKQFSSIRIDDDLFEGKSYYFEEVNIMASLIREVESLHQNIFILDEVFKGTNTIERIAAAKAILSYLNRNNNIVIVSTHDIELAEMLKQEFDLYHFSETIENNQLHFDHTIKAGKLTTRNAIRILELSDYPEVITQEANALSKLFLEAK